MTDRELLELAAMAAGIDLVWDEPPADWPPLVYDGEFYQQWIPLDDDGDAMRLTVKLNLAVESTRNVSVVVCADYGNNGYDVEVFELLKDADPYAATRRAIVRAAAEIGRKMK